MTELAPALLILLVVLYAILFCDPYDDDLPGGGHRA